ncbi:Afadin-like protein [Sarcoptes scabiei]|uniref:Afadin-like protein n=1 Tax=Sarcoptes scabiei TaxID=52283 RepID=A0A132AGN6_SARSC|nr:Afadin-like protein [Sarcoptes scabiei]
MPMNPIISTETPIPNESNPSTTGSSVGGKKISNKTIDSMERENLRNIIAQWNANRLDLFEISEPNEDLEFYGVMRFYFQDAGQKVATKCMRISSTASTADVINNLIEKFRPDIRMLSVPEYALYEIHENGEERKLAGSEFPLLVQLNWHKDDREGRFLLRLIDEKTYLPEFNKNNSTIFNRKLSKREKKEKKKNEKREKAQKSNQKDSKGKDSLAEKLYNELPETSFTRSISNPEAVMRRRRQQKLEKKLQQFSQEGGPEAGGTLRIFGESINQDVPYKTILLSTRDTATFAIKEILEKYGKNKEEYQQYCLVQVIMPYNNGDLVASTTTATNPPLNNVGPTTNTNSGQASSGINEQQLETIANNTSTSVVNNDIREYILDDDDCPLIIERSHIKSRGVLTFHIRRRPPDYQPRRRKKKIGSNNLDGVAVDETEADSRNLPYLLEVNPDGSEIFMKDYVPKHYYLNLNVIEIGSDLSNLTETVMMPIANNGNNEMRSSSSRLRIQVQGPGIHPHHCTLIISDGIFMITPVSREAETSVNGTRIFEAAILKPGMLLRIGKSMTFKLVDESLMKRHSQLSVGPTMTALYHRHNHSYPQTLPQLPQQQQYLNNESLHSPTSIKSSSYETTFDSDGKVEILTKHQDLSSMGQLQRHQTMGSLTRSRNNPTNMNQLPNQTQHSPNVSGRPMMNGAGGGGGGGTIIPANNQNLRKGDNILPAILEVGEDLEDVFLASIIKRIDPNQVQFKLCITYSLYMVTRYRASTYFKPEITPEIRAELLIAFCVKYSNMIKMIINENHKNKPSLAFWLANSSEILYFLKNDRHLSAFTFESQDILGDAVRLAFDYLVICQQNELEESMLNFAKEMNDQTSNSMQTITNDILNVLSNSMQLLRRFRVNAALTIQLFSQLFHFINMSFFNRVIGTNESNFCSKIYGLKLKQCLGQIELWAEKQGLELAAECHLARIIQTAMFLEQPKILATDPNSILGNFFKLNSLQIQALCERYRSEEILFQTETISSIIKIARSTTDELILKDGREIRLEEESDLQLPFLLPEDGYSCDIVRGIPAGLQDFIQSLVQARVCSLTTQPTASGFWTIYFINFQADAVNHRQQLSESFQSQEYDNQMITKHGSLAEQNSSSAQFMQIPSSSDQLSHVVLSGSSTTKPIPSQEIGSSKQPPMPMSTKMMNPVNNFQTYGTIRMMSEPDVQTIKLQKINNGIGLSIVAARGANQSQLGIYIKSVVKGGAADLDGRLEAGDQLLKVDGQSLIGITQEKAAEAMTQTGPIVTLDVAKQGALYHGLGGILSPQFQSNTLIQNKNMNLRPCYMPNVTDFNGMNRFNNGQFNKMHTQFSSAAALQQARMPGYNSLPLPLNYNYRNQMGYFNMPMNSMTMRPDSQMSFNSQTNLLNPSALVNNNRINMSTASLPANATAVGIGGGGPYQNHEERHYQNIQIYQLNPNVPNQKLPQNVVPYSNQSQGSRALLHSSQSSLLQPLNTTTMVGEMSTASTATISNRPVSQIVTTREQEQILNEGVVGMLNPTNQSIIEQQIRQREILRQEAKMEEIREELRHRFREGDPNSSAATYQHQNTINRGPPFSNNLRSRFSSEQTLTLNPSQQQIQMNGLRSNGSTFNTDIQQKIEETKRSRDDEIKHLESLPYRNPKSEERLKKLILEREFQKRAEEHRDEDDDEVLDLAEHRERILSIQQDLERAKQRRLERDQSGSDANNLDSRTRRLLEEEQNNRINKDEH